ncbi:hypothetical protein ENUP19_0097G0002 [Entamoeba nuttalli]|uniref:Uncharacterized protein n=2 Tax=Entamoeba nuttalli TaxID=412467 RepID=K2H5E7_ENTNP|nr:hypothetical protein ENU1_008930 [Entamoeba nuttalli P19]EKE42823.1 hypothetical protein ENU1_008930 [Entamoeba nuttalli P19]|eukprot:XP_008854845.1 hypothetical protein ENU1_008930 [Entamoeba nuttalli P19]
MKKSICQSKIDSKKQEVHLEMVLFSILNELNYNLELEKFYKKSKYETQLVKVHDIYIEEKGRRINTTFKKYVIDGCKEGNENYYKRNYDALTMNWMIEECLKHKVHFEFRGTRSAKYTVVMKKIKSIQWNGVLIESSLIDLLGIQLLDSLKNLLSGNNRQSESSLILLPSHSFSFLSSLRSMGFFFQHPTCNDLNHCHCTKVVNNECEHGFENGQCDICSFQSNNSSELTSASSVDSSLSVFLPVHSSYYHIL